MLPLFRFYIQTLLTLCLVLPSMFISWGLIASFINLNWIYMDIANWEDKSRALLLFASIFVSIIATAHKRVFLVSNNLSRRIR